MFLYVCDYYDVALGEPRLAVWQQVPPSLLIGTDAQSQSGQKRAVALPIVSLLRI
jgi:hypothetical protein